MSYQPRHFRTEYITASRPSSPASFCLTQNPAYRRLPLLSAPEVQLPGILWQGFCLLITPANSLFSVYLLLHGPAPLLTAARTSVPAPRQARFCRRRARRLYRSATLLPPFDQVIADKTKLRRSSSEPHAIIKGFFASSNVSMISFSSLALDSSEQAEGRYTRRL